MNKTIWAMALLLSALVTPALATETLTCVDEEFVGMTWESGTKERIRGSKADFTVEVISATQREISDSTGSMTMACAPAALKPDDGVIACIDSTRTWNWAFKELAYTRSSITSPAIGLRGILLVAHGTCTKG